MGAYLGSVVWLRVDHVNKLSAEGQLERFGSQDKVLLELSTPFVVLPRICCCAGPVQRKRVG